MKKAVSLGLAAAMALSLTACGGGDATTETKAPESSAEASGNSSESSEASDSAAEGADGEVFKIGHIGPLSGSTAVYGMATQNGAQIAIDEINAAGGINGYQIAYNSQDDENDAEKVINAYNTLKDWGMQMLIGTTTSTPCVEVAGQTSVDNMFQITPSGSAVECAAQPNVFRVCFADPAQGAASAQYIGGNKIASKVAVIYDGSSVYSSGIYEQFAAEAGSQGIEVVSAEPFTADSNTDFNTQLQKAKDSGAELVFLPIYYTEASLILAQADAMGFDPIFFGCDGMDGILQVENFDTSLAEELMLLTPFAADATDELTVNFVTQYKERYNEIPNQFAADAYDAVYAIKAAAEDAGITPDMDAASIGEALAASMPNISIDAITGLSGEKTTWTADGEPNKAPKAVQIKDGVYVSMD
ncbi:ABC transporter substrate-binding protein [Lachnospiraceae bacterium 62-35]